MLATVLGPFDRPPECNCSLRHDGFLAVEDRLRTEAAAYIGRDDADGFGIALEHFGKRALGEMRRLRPGPDGKIAGAGVARGEDGAALERMAAAAVMPELFLEGVCGGSERAGDIAITDFEDRSGVVGRVEMRARGAVFERGATITRRRQRFIIDLDVRGGILGDVTRICDNDRDR